MGQMRVRRTGPWVKISCPFSWVQFIPRVFHGVGQAVDPHLDSHHFRRFCNKKAPKTEVFDAFWSCWADSNCRPHPYQFFSGCFVLKPETLAAQGFQAFLFCVLVSLILFLRMGFFDARMGFVWVLQRSIRGSSLTHLTHLF